MNEKIDVGNPSGYIVIGDDKGMLTVNSTTTTEPVPATTKTKEDLSVLENRVKDALRKQMLLRESYSGTSTGRVAEEKKEEVKPVPKNIPLLPGQVEFTKLTGVESLPSGLKDFGVTVHTVSDPYMTAFIPKVNPTYNVQIEEAHALLMAWEMGEKVLITGPTGSGKSSLIEHACALTNRPMIRVNMSGDVESSVLFGQLTVEGGGTLWKDGPVTEAVRKGAVVLLDEWDVTPPEILFSLQWLFEENGKLFLKEMPGDSGDKFVIPHDNFRLVCAGNTVGQGDETGRYSGTNVQNNASIDRFQTTIVLNYLSPTHEEKIVVDNCKGVKLAVAKKMVSLANLVRTACSQGNINLTMSPRTLVNWGKKSVVYGNTERSLQLAFTNKLRESDLKIVAELYQKVFGTVLK